MNRKFRFRFRAAIGAFLLGMIMPGVALAISPPSVTGLEVALTDEGIELSWDEPEEETDIVQYKVYYSNESILENEGAWTGSGETVGNENRFLFEGLIPGQKTYAAATAVNAAGEESEFIEEEISFVFDGSLEATPAIELEPTVGNTEVGSAATDFIILDEGSPVTVDPDDLGSSLEVIESEATNDPDVGALFQGTLKLLSARAISPTRVSLTFSHFIEISDNDAPQAFRILDSAGDVLGINTLTIDQADVILETEEQQANVVYEVSVFDPLRGVPGLALDSISRQTFFRGHSGGLEASVGGAESADLFPSDVSNMVLQAEQTSDGLYHVEATWQIATMPAGYIVRQTRDGGRTFSPASRLPGDYGGVELDGVMPGRFGVFVQTFGGQGYVSPGVLVNVDLPVENHSRQPIVARPDGSIPTAPVDEEHIPEQEWPEYPIDTETEGDLSESGAGLIAGLAAAGAFAGWKRSRRAKK
jgi:hypothetical protein